MKIVLKIKILRDFIPAIVHIRFFEEPFLAALARLTSALENYSAIEEWTNRQYNLFQPIY